MTNEQEIVWSVFGVYLNDLKAYSTKPDRPTFKRLEEVRDRAIKALEQTRWIPVSERLPKENEYIGNVCKYYLIQDEYGDMHVAHLSNVGWIPMHSLKAIGDEIIAWRELPESYEEEQDG